MIGMTKYSAFFRIGDDNLDPLEITKLLRINPDKAHKKGDPSTMQSKKGKPVVFSPFSTGLWGISSTEGEYIDLECHIRNLLSKLYPLKDELIELSKRGYKMDMFCGAFTHEVHQPGFKINPDVLFMLGELNIELSVCIY